MRCTTALYGLICLFSLSACGLGETAATAGLQAKQAEQAQQQMEQLKQQIDHANQASNRRLEDAMKQNQ